MAAPSVRHPAADRKFVSPKQRNEYRRLFSRVSPTLFGWRPLADMPHRAMTMVKNRAVRSILFRKSKTAAETRKRRKRQDLSLLADFLANRMSAAGMAHVVKAPSAFRRTAWGVILACTAAAMSFMTYRVLQEYLSYPTIMRSKAIAAKELEFPAVTICGLTPVPRLFAIEAGLLYMESMRSLLDSLPRYSISEAEKTRCLKDPLCQWSWFDDECLCHANPCQTLHCYPDADLSDDQCLCSMLMCQWNGSAAACATEVEGDSMQCRCHTQFVYPLANMHTHGVCNQERCENGPHKPMESALPESFRQWLSVLNTTEQIRDLLVKLKTSRTKDLRDVERFFLPPVYITDDYGFPADSFILSCSFGVQDCWDLVTLYTPSNGKCYMFNYVGNEVNHKKEVRMVDQAGRMSGLQLFLRSRANDSLPLLTRQLGVRLIIHDPRTIPVTSEDGIDLRPGDMTSINVGYVETIRLGPPWGKCAKNGQKLGNFTGDPYRQNDCERECVNQEVFQRCGCYHPKFMRATTVPQRKVICATNGSEDVEVDRCFIKTLWDNDHGNIRCNCPPPCKEKNYETSMSTSKLNDDFFRMMKKAKSLAVVNGTPSVTDSDFDTSLIGVQVFYNSLYVISINETAIYSWESLVANIGGNMGLFLGLSLVTLLEIAEFLADTVIRVLSRRRRARRVIHHNS